MADTRDDKSRILAAVAASDRDWAALRGRLEDIERIANGGQIPGDERDELIVRSMAYTVAIHLHLAAVQSLVDPEG